MRIFRVLSMVMLGLAVTWAAGQVAPGDAGGQREPVPELSQEEIEAEIARAEAALEGGPPPDFRPTRPLPADVPVDLPSDI